MSLITKQVKELQEEANLCIIDGNRIMADMLRKAADEIEELSAKLQAAQMERSSAHYHNGWIPVDERLPEKTGFYLATIDGELVGSEMPFVGLAEFWDGKWFDDEDDYKAILAWMPLPEPLKIER